jgi:hypothetical protein
VRPKSFSSQWYVWHKLHSYLAPTLTTSPNGPKQHGPRHLGVQSGASKTILEPIVHLAESVRLSSTDSNTVSKRTETRIDLTHVT